MKVKLTNEDRCAIDLVLEHRAATGGDLSNCYEKSNGRSLKRRVDAVEKIFDVLDAAPAAEPSATLVASTLKFIEANAHRHVAATASEAHANQQAHRRIAHAPEHRSLH